MCPLAQGRRAQRNNGEAKVQVLAKLAGRHRGRQVAIGRGQHAHVHLEGRLAAHARQLARLQHAQDLGLRRQAHVADLVEEDGSAVGQFEKTLLARGRARERPALVTEQLGLDELGRNSGAVHLDEGFVAQRAFAVDGARDEFLASTRLAGDKHARARWRHLGNLGVERGHGWALPDHLETAFGDRAQPRHLAHHGPPFEGVAQRHDQPLAIERLFQEIVSAGLGRANCVGERAVTGNHDHHGFGLRLGAFLLLRARLAHGFQHFVPRDIGQLHVEKNHIGRDVGKPGQGFFPARGLVDRVALALEHHAHGTADIFLVIDDKNRGGHGCLDFTSSPLALDRRSTSPDPWSPRTHVAREWQCPDIPSEPRDPGRQ